MNFFEIILTFSYVIFGTGLISLGLYLHDKIDRNKADLKKIKVVMTNLKDAVE